MIRKYDNKRRSSSKDGLDPPKHTEDRNMFFALLIDQLKESKLKPGWREET